METRDLANATIDSLRFAAEGGCISGRLAVEFLGRLHDGLSTRQGWLDCTLTGLSDLGESGDGLGLRLRVSGRLGLLCQRCLSEMEFDCAIDSRLLLIPPGQEWPEAELETEEYDAIAAERELAVRSLVEEEVLLTLPIVPRHEVCRFPDEAAAARSERGDSPFNVLSGLKKH